MLRRASSGLARAVIPVRSVASKRLASVLITPRAQTNVIFQKAPKISVVHNVARRYASSYPSHTKIGMPALSPTMTQGNIAKWNKKVGDKVSAGDAIAEIETDKSSMAFESTEDGYLAKILVPEGTKDVPVNKLIAVLVDSKDDVAKFTDYTEGGAKSTSAATPPPPPPPKAAAPSPKQAPQQQPQQTKPAAPSKSYPPHITVGMPALSPTMAKGNIAGWRKKEGDKVNAGDIIAEIETDKSTMEFECTEEGYLAKILYPGKATDITVNVPIAILVDSKDDIPKFKDYSPQQKESQQPSQESQEQPQQGEQPQQKQQPQQQQQPSGGRVVASPLAKVLGKEHGVDLSQIRGTGPNNRIIRDDVLEFVAAQKDKPAQVQAAAPEAAPKAPKAAPAPPSSASYTDVPVSQIRKITAERLLLSKQTIPHYYLTMDIRVDKLLKLRAELNDQSNGKYKLSVNDFIIKASALAMHKVPAVNSSWNEQFIRKYNNVDINVAVNTDQGLFTPIVKDADRRGLSDIANTVKVLADKAKAGKLAPAEFQGGTFTISNLGMFGIKQFAAVINPPQAAILAVGGASQRLVPAQEGKSSQAAEQQHEIATVLTVTLSCDHRVIDGAVGAEWLQAFKEYLENPLKLLL